MINVSKLSNTELKIFVLPVPNFDPTDLNAYEFNRSTGKMEVARDQADPNKYTEELREHLISWNKDHIADMEIDRLNAIAEIRKNIKW
jgi:hypothetical protein